MSCFVMHAETVKVIATPSCRLQAIELNGKAEVDMYVSRLVLQQLRDDLLELFPLVEDRWTCGVCGENTCRYASVKNKWVNGPIRCPIGNPCEIEAAWIKDGAPPEEPPVAEAEAAAREVDGAGRIVDPLWAAADEFARVFWTDDLQIAACRDKILAVCQAMEVKTDGSK